MGAIKRTTSALRRLISTFSSSWPPKVPRSAIIQVMEQAVPSVGWAIIRRGGLKYGKVRSAISAGMRVAAATMEMQCFLEMPKGRKGGGWRGKARCGFHHAARHLGDEHHDWQDWHGYLDTSKTSGIM